MSNTKYVAIWDDRWNDYKWHRRSEAHRNFEESQGLPIPENCEEIVYYATGKIITRADGEQAEIYELSPPPQPSTPSAPGSH